MGALILNQLKSFCFKPMPCFMLCFMSVMTFFNSQTIYFSGVCIIFMLCFSQLGPQTCPEVPYEEQQYVLSRYLLYLLLVHGALLWLSALIWLGSMVSPWQLGFTTETLMVLTTAYMFDIVFISFAVPLSLSTDRGISRLMTMMLLVIICSLMMAMKGLMPYLPLNLQEVCPMLPSLPWTVFLMSVVVFWRRSGQTNQQALAESEKDRPQNTLNPIAGRSE